LNIIQQSTLYLPTHLFRQTSPTITFVLFSQTFIVTYSRKGITEEKNYFWDFHGGKPSERGVNFLAQNGANWRRRSADGLV